MIQITLFLCPYLLQSQQITSPCNKAFPGEITLEYRSVSVFWANTLVCAFGGWKRSEFSQRGIPPSAKPIFDDLICRLDRPSLYEVFDRFKDVFAEGVNSSPGKATLYAALSHEPNYTDPKDDLAAGIAYWTIACRIDGDGPRGPWNELHKVADRYLLKASLEGDLDQQSYASLAYAHSATMEISDSDRSVWSAMQTPGQESITRSKRHAPQFSSAWWKQDHSRLMEAQRRSIVTYNRFKYTAPVRALLAADWLEKLCDLLGETKEEKRWGMVRVTEFEAYSSWWKQ